MGYSIEERLREFINPVGAGDARVLSGCEFLNKSLTDSQLLDLAVRVVVRREDVEDALRGVLGNDIIIDTSLALALIRFRVKASVLSKELGDGEAVSNRDLVKSDSVSYTLPRTFSESNDIDSVLGECMVPPDAINPLADMSFLVEVQKRRVIQQLREIGRSPSSFMMNKAILGTIESMRALIKDVAQMQVDFGLRRKIPRQIDLKIQNAFDTFLVNVGDEKSAVSDLTKNIISILEEDVVDAEFSDSREEQ